MMRRFWLSGVALIVAVAIGAVLVTPLSGVPARPVVASTRGMVTSAQVLASQAGVEILRQGGNAIDAAVATGLALAVVYPSAGNLGGGGFMLIHRTDGGDVAIDCREVAPAAATRTMYVGSDGKLIAGEGSSTLGWRAGGVPGTVAGYGLAWKKYGSGRVTWAEVCEPARRLAAEGFVVTAELARSLRAAAEHLDHDAEPKRIYHDGGKFFPAGERWKQPDLAATLTRLQGGGPEEFYRGETARRIAAAMAGHAGSIALADLAAYRPVERAPLRGRYRGCEIVTMPPPSSGGVALLQMLAMLEPHDVGALGHGSAAQVHLFAEVMTRAFRDRAEYLGDPDFVRVPVAELLAPDYLARRMADFSPERATPADAVQPGLGAFVPVAVPHESKETTHYSVVDGAGNAVSVTTTLNGAYGSGVTIPGTGILLNNEMDDFMSAPGVPNLYGLIQGEANAIAPGKRPLSSMTPTIVLRDGRLVLVTGSPGGPTIINTVLQVVTNVIDFRMPVNEAVAASRLNEQWRPDVLTCEHAGLAPAVAAQLTAWGHHLVERGDRVDQYQGDAETIAIDPATGARRGASDPRRPDGGAVGE